MAFDFEELAVRRSNCDSCWPAHMVSLDVEFDKPNEDRLTSGTIEKFLVNLGAIKSVGI